MRHNETYSQNIFIHQGGKDENQEFGKVLAAPKATDCRPWAFKTQQSDSQITRIR
jgi:hypothetical protein